ncbi:SET domain-containing protein 9-like isoform X2 [Amphibalanus amphitrite]|uniref:SET domain-containing protein 9-like isoform X2 n=1 Tax=Amphibalanus amphitrite TaxID=1232801 RepID=UPI001C91C622|nr:SET domain-containing protein 9-like isoform X2 [Amphibalanus amphitrite]
MHCGAVGIESMRKELKTQQDCIVHHESAVNSVFEVLTLLNENISPFETQYVQHEKANQLLLRRLGFEVRRQRSAVPAAGRGVVVTRGTVPAGAVCAWYPGTVYLPGDPLLLASIGNQFVFACADGVHVDGRGGGLSGLLFGSCAGRDHMGPYPAADRSWRTELPANPLAVGQFVNNQSPGFPSNVRYQEVDLPAVPYPLRRYLPYAWYRARVPPPMRAVVLVAQRDIRAGEELFANYFTVVHDS